MMRKLLFFVCLFMIFLVSSVSAEVIISEIMYAPTDELGGTYAEWIELYNPSDNVVNLTEWKIADPSNHTIEGENLQVPSKEYIVVIKSAFFSNFSEYYDISAQTAKAGFYLNNNGENILLINSNGSIIADLTYSQSWGGNGNNKSLQLFEDDWCEGIPTPGKANICQQAAYCGDSICNGNENCTGCEEDCLEEGNVCCEGTAYSGNCCNNEDCSDNYVCQNHVCNETEPETNGEEETGETDNIIQNITNTTAKKTSENKTKSITSSAIEQTESKKVIYQSKTDKTKDAALYLAAGLFVILLIYFLKSNKKG